MLEAGIISLIIASAAATVALVVKFALLSKCQNITVCWGCCSITRDTAHEVDITPNQGDSTRTSI